MPTQLPRPLALGYSHPTTYHDSYLGLPQPPPAGWRTWNGQPVCILKAKTLADGRRPGWVTACGSHQPTCPQHAKPMSFSATRKTPRLGGGTGLCHPSRAICFKPFGSWRLMHKAQAATKSIAPRSHSHWCASARSPPDRPAHQRSMPLSEIVEPQTQEGRPRASVSGVTMVALRLVSSHRRLSVSAARAHTPLWPPAGLGQAHAELAPWPPGPFGGTSGRGRTVTVVSPPDSSNRRAFLNGAPPAFNGAGQAACTLPTSRAIRLHFVRQDVRSPACCAGGGRRFKRLLGGGVMRCTAWPANTASPGFWGFERARLQRHGRRGQW